MVTTLIKLTEEVIKKYNPCQKDGDKCVAGDPIPCCDKSRFKLAVECDNCKNPNLDCRLWFCKTAIKNSSKECIETLKDIERIAIRYGFIKHPYLGERYVGEKIF